MNDLLTKHYQVTQQLLRALKLYIECKNYGIHGFFIQTANTVLNNLMWELYHQEVVQTYLNNQLYEIKQNIKEVPVYLDFRVLPTETVKQLKEEAYLAFTEYAKFPQSCYVQKVKYVLEQLND